MHTASYVSLSTQSALHLDTKNYWLPFCSGVTNGICLSIGLPSTYVCVLLYPTMSYINSAQFETYRWNIPSSPLCLRRFFSRKTRFYRYLRAFFTLLRGWSGREKEGKSYRDVRRKITLVRLSESHESGEIRLCHAFTAIRYIYWLPRCATWLISHTVHIVVGTNLLSENVLVSTVSI